PLGLYYHDTQFLSGFGLRVNGARPLLLSANTEQNYVLERRHVVLLGRYSSRRIPSRTTWRRSSSCIPRARRSDRSGTARRRSPSVARASSPTGCASASAS